MKWNDKLNKRYTLVSIYVIVTAIIIYCLSLIAKSAPAIITEIMNGVHWIVRVSRPIFIGFVIAYLLDPIIEFTENQYKKLVNKFYLNKENKSKVKNISEQKKSYLYNNYIKLGGSLEDRLDKRLKSCRTWSVFTALFLLVIVFGLIISLLVYSVTNQLRLANFNDIMVLAESFMKSITDFINSMQVKLENLDIQSTEISQYVKDATSYILNSLKNMAYTVVSSLKNVSSYITTFLFSLIIGIYFMIDGAMIKEYIKKVGDALISDKWNRRIRGFLTDADTVFSGYIRGQLSDALVMMILISLTLSVVGVKFAIIIGIFAGIGNLIPYCGPFIAYFSTTIVCIVNGQYKELIVAIIALFIIQAIDGNVIAPKLLSKNIEIHPVLVIIFLIFGSAIGGLLGMLLAVPVGALIKLLFVRFINQRIEEKQNTPII